jgi:hypothetical protein
LFCGFKAGTAEGFEEGFDGGNIGSHLAGEAALGIVGKAKNVRHLTAEFEDAIDIPQIIIVPRGCPTDHSFVDLFAEVAALAVLHEGAITRRVKGNHPGAIGWGGGFMSGGSG